MWLLAPVLALLIGSPRLLGTEGAVSDSKALLNPDSKEMNARAPERFGVRLETTKGDVLIEIERVWAPLGVDRFYNLVRAGYYDDVRISRIVAPKWAQFGINGDPKIAKIWRDRTFPDEPRVLPNDRGTIAFAFAVPNGRSTQVFINLRDNRETHDKEPFVPFGRITAGMDVVDSWYSDYGENAGSGIRSGKQGPIFEGGNAWLDREYPKLDSIKRAVVVSPSDSKKPR
jgi:peptidyl-prolyl cis-trans isomerase A (cyclophilin A)